MGNLFKALEEGVKNLSDKGTDGKETPPSEPLISEPESIIALELTDILRDYALMTVHLDANGHPVAGYYNFSKQAIREQFSERLTKATGFDPMTIYASNEPLDYSYIKKITEAKETLARAMALERILILEKYAKENKVSFSCAIAYEMLQPFKCQTYWHSSSIGC